MRKRGDVVIVRVAQCVASTAETVADTPCGRISNESRCDW